MSELIGIVLFGSVTRGAADRQSDIDVLVVVDGDPTYGRRLCIQVARDIEGETFDGQRYEFEILVETPDSAVSHGSELAEIFERRCMELFPEVRTDADWTRRSQATSLCG